MVPISEVPSSSEGEMPHNNQLPVDVTNFDITLVDVSNLQSSSEDDGPYEHAHFEENQIEIANTAPPCGLVDLITHPISNVSINRLYQPQHSPITIRSLALEDLEEEQEVPLTKLRKIKEALKPNLKFLPAKLSYFLYFSGLSLINTFFTIFLVNLGLDPEQAGLIQVARSGTMIGSSLFWGWLAHRTQRNMLIICIELLVSTALVNLMPWLSHLMVDTETAMAHQSHVDQTLNQTFAAIEPSTTMDELQKLFGLEFAASHYRTASPYLFGVMLALSVGFTFFIGGALLLIETRVYNMTKTSRGCNQYGHQRLWGSLSFAITPLIAGGIMEVMPAYLDIQKDPIQVVFYMYMVVMIGAVVCCAFLFRKEEEKKLSVIIGEASDMYSTQETSGGQWSPVKKVLKKTFLRGNNLMLFINIFFLGLVYGIQWNFQFIFMQEVGASKMMMGLCVTIQLLVEAMVYPCAMKMITWLGGNKVVTTITCFSYAVLFFTISVTTSPYLMVIPAAFLGFSFTLFHNATMEDLHKIGGTRLLTILQTLYHVVFTGAGCSVSGVVGGIVYHNYSGRVLFFVSGCIMALFSVLNGTYAILDRKCGEMKKEEITKDDGVIKDVYNVGSDCDEGIFDVL